MAPQCTLPAGPAAAELVADAVPVDECFPVGVVMVFVPVLDSAAKEALDFSDREDCLARAVEDMGHVGALSEGSSESQGLSSRRL